jgi:hypothetical protein
MGVSFIVDFFDFDKSTKKAAWTKKIFKNRLQISENAVSLQRNQEMMADL